MRNADDSVTTRRRVVGGIAAILAAECFPNLGFAASGVTKALAARDAFLARSGSTTGGTPPSPPSPSFDGLKFTANRANSSVSLRSVGSLAPAVSLFTSTDCATWTPYSIGTTISLAHAGDYVCFRAGIEGNERMAVGVYGYHQFVMSGIISASGNVMSLLDTSMQSVTAGSYAFYRLFLNCGVLTTSPELPATVLGEYCYREMFKSCWLTTPPSLPATDLAPYCYNSMFNGCEYLESVPNLPATTLKSLCYGGMFNGCTRLAGTPTLPATTLDSYCYIGMFTGATKITAARMRYNCGYSASTHGTLATDHSVAVSYYY